MADTLDLTNPRDVVRMIIADNKRLHSPEWGWVAFFDFGRASGVTASIMIAFDRARMVITRAADENVQIQFPPESVGKCVDLAFHFGGLFRGCEPPPQTKAALEREVRRARAELDILRDENQALRRRFPANTNR